MQSQTEGSEFVEKKTIFVYKNCEIDWRKKQNHLKLAEGSYIIKVSWACESSKKWKKNGNSNEHIHSLNRVWDKNATEPSISLEFLSQWDIRKKIMPTKEMKKIKKLKNLRVCIGKWKIYCAATVAVAGINGWPLTHNEWMNDRLEGKNGYY